MHSTLNKKVCLSELIDVRHGFAFSGEGISEEPSGNILLTPGNFAIGGGFKGDKFKYFVGDIPSNYVLHQGDLIVTMTDLSKQTDTLGYPALVPQSSGVCYLHNQRLGKVLIHQENTIDKRYLYYVLCSAEYRNEVLASATGTTVKHTSPNRIMAHKFTLPPLPAQKRIADILGSLDDKIELNRKMNETLEGMARALFKSWFVDFDPVVAKSEGRQPEGMDAETAKLFSDSFEDSELGRIPKGWKVGCVGDNFNLTMGQSPDGSTYNEIERGIPFYQGRRDFGFRYPELRVYCDSPTRIAEEGDTLVSVRAPVGDINMASARCCIGRGVAAVRHRTGSRSFTFYSLHELQPDLQTFEAHGTVFGAINKDQFQALSIVTPPAALVHAFERVSSAVDDQVELLTQEINTLATMRDSLLPRLLSGDVRVLDKGVIL